MTGFDVVIPARYGSSRLPGKPLCRIGELPLIARVVERARLSGADQIVVATDDERVAAAVRDVGGQVLLTRTDCRSGSDRLAEAVHRLGLRFDRPVVNLQGDEPFMPAELIRAVAYALGGNDSRSMATAAHPLPADVSPEEPHVVKVVQARTGDALYFSRAPIPWHGEERGVAALQHVGLYAYRAGFLEQFASWAPTPLECAEGLEQLRALENGVAIRVVETEYSPGIGVDTPEDLERARALIEDQDC